MHKVLIDYFSYKIISKAFSIHSTSRFFTQRIFLSYTIILPLI
ncbi:hypothetical protein A1OE_1012 [Candidatus Endolissoclinum faulkneri L2]|uniref:Uncharacterized protein n=1 Tax=Candidatus Endolissoclinum faulkneri L2 TaxID=1193729 RepID=K7ZD50_9PROT|nr:hypothetical protein A1OE_1012 [Candidatus Endolissoclinum faulkneri L2]